MLSIKNIKRLKLERKQSGCGALAPFTSIPQSTLTWNHVPEKNGRTFFTVCAVTSPTFFNGRGG